MIYSLIFLVLPLVAAQDEYFGVPLGLIKYKKWNTSAEVFAADDHTLVLTHFDHQPFEAGCISLMVGRARKKDQGRTVTNGVLLPYSKPNFAWDDLEMLKRSRAKRHVFQHIMESWPRFAHLRLEEKKPMDKPMEERGMDGVRGGHGVRAGHGMNDGIHLEMKDREPLKSDNSTTAPPLVILRKENVVKKMMKEKMEMSNMRRLIEEGMNKERDRFEEMPGKVMTSTMDLMKEEEKEKVKEENEDSDEIELVLERGPGLRVMTPEELDHLRKKSRKLAKTEKSLKILRSSDFSSMDKETTETDVGIVELEEDGSDEEDSIKLAEKISKMIEKKEKERETLEIVVNKQERKENDKKKGQEKAREDGNVVKAGIGKSAGIVVVKGIGKSPGIVKKGKAIMQTKNPLRTSATTLQTTMSTEMSLKTTRDEQFQPKMTTMMEMQPTITTTQRTNDETTLEEILQVKAKPEETTTIAAPMTTTVKIEPTTAEHDDVEMKNEEKIAQTETSPLLETTTITAIGKFEKKKDDEMEVLLKEIGVKDRSAKIENRKPKYQKLDVLNQFSIPQINDGKAAFLLTNGASLADYRWIGLYNQCTKEPVPLISLDGLDAPREEIISPIKGKNKHISSGPVRILNCNTILIPDFRFVEKMEKPDSYFYVGIGLFPNKIEGQKKARVLGFEGNEPLENYHGDDVMIRLPAGLRTFDVDFLAIYNEAEREYFGFVTLPSVLVPPCAE